MEIIIHRELTFNSFIDESEIIKRDMALTILMLLPNEIEGRLSAARFKRRLSD